MGPVRFCVLAGCLRGVSYDPYAQRTEQRSGSDSFERHANDRKAAAHGGVQGAREVLKDYQPLFEYHMP